jgi:membrane dipeptidase
MIDKGKAAILLVMAVLTLSAAPSEACFSIVVGKDASTDGGVLVGHNEDDYPPQVVHHHKVPRRTYGPGEQVVLRNGGVLEQVEQTWAYFWSEMPGMLFSDSCVNEWGVTVTSDNCPSREDRAELSEDGIGWMLRRLIAQRARTAREGVRLAGRLVERFGYIASGRTYIIADPDEGWLFCVVQGKRWLARRVADDEVAMVANTYTIRQVDLSDEDNVLASADIVTYAVRRGWYEPARDGPFDFAAVYANPASAAHPDNAGRQWSGLRYVARDPIAPGFDLPFSVVPRHKLSAADIMEILRHDEADKPEPSTSDSGFGCALCSGATQTSFVAQLRSNLPPEVGVVYWGCLAEPRTSVYLPFHFGISDFPAGFRMESEQPAGDVYDRKVAAPFAADPGEAFWTFSNFRDKVDRQGPALVAAARSGALRIESRAVAMQKPLEEMAKRLHETDRTVAGEVLANFSKGLYLSALEGMDKVLRQPADDERIVARAKAIHEAAITIDSHVDIADELYATADLDPGIDDPQLRCDLVKMAKGGIDGVFLAVYVRQAPKLNAETYAEAQRMAESKFDAIARLTRSMYPDRCALALCPDDVERIIATGRKAIMIGIENGFPIGEDLDLLNHYYNRGARYVTLCHTAHNQICDSSSEPEPLHNGLSPFGRSAVARMNELGMMCDASHISEKSFFDLLEVTRAPILVSHSGCSAVHPHDRNLTDEQLRALRDNGGVIQIVALDAYLRPETPERVDAVRRLREELGIPSYAERQRWSTAQRAAMRPRLREYYRRYEEMAETVPIATVKDFVDHIDHAVRVAGIDHVGVGTDFDGGGAVSGFANHAEALNVTEELVRRGYSDEDIRKIWGGNLLRLWRRVEAVSTKR